MGCGLWILEVLQAHLLSRHRKIYLLLFYQILKIRQEESCRGGRLSDEMMTTGKAQ
jgi:hypothetical protein